MYNNPSQTYVIANLNHTFNDWIHTGCAFGCIQLEIDRYLLMIDQHHTQATHINNRIYIKTQYICVS